MFEVIFAWVAASIYGIGLIVTSTETSSSPLILCVEKTSSKSWRDKVRKQPGSSNEAQQH